jgi:hypothetical protein
MDGNEILGIYSHGIDVAYWRLWESMASMVHGKLIDYDDDKMSNKYLELNMT